MRKVVDFIRQIAPPGGADEATDGQLLERFIGRRDEAAFASLLRRHGPLVFAVCRRALPTVQDAEDAFQATFLVLARKAASIAKRGSLASWLHGVARRIARRIRADIARRRALEARSQFLQAPDSLRELVWRDLRLLLDEEVEGLPEKYRGAFVLCYMEGKTQDEAAHLLGCPRGTVSSRLVRARAILRVRLSRRGLTLSAAFATTMLARTPASSVVPSNLMGATVRAVLQTGAGRLAGAGLVSARIVSLTEGVVKAMTMTKFQGAALLLALGAALAGTGAVALHRVPAAPPPVAEERQPAPKNSEPANPPSLLAQPDRAKAEPAAEPSTNPAEEYLQLCAKKLASLDSFAATVRRTSVDKTFRVTEVYEGTIKYLRPNMAMQEMRRKENADHVVKYVRTGNRLYEYDPREKEVRLHELQPGGLYQTFLPSFWTAELGLGPFAWFMKSEETKRGCHLKVVKEDQWYIYIELQPRTREEKAAFRRGRLVLTKSNYLPRQSWFELPNGHEVQWDILRMEPNIAMPRGEFAEPHLPPGWKLRRLSPGQDKPTGKTASPPDPDQP